MNTKTVYAGWETAGDLADRTSHFILHYILTQNQHIFFAIPIAPASLSMV